MPLIFLFLTFLPFYYDVPVPDKKALAGAWEQEKPDGSRGLLILDEDFFAITYFKTDAPEFISTEGGRWKQAPDGSMLLAWEFNTRDSSLVGKQKAFKISSKEKLLSFSGASWKQIDNGTPGALKGAWLITGRMRDGEMTSMTPGARKTMKILSGTRFQWIAYNSETGEFFGTGGGAYTTNNGSYTEDIHFFSRDNARVGDSLKFKYELKDKHWHHSGYSSKGEPLYEIWTTRQMLGI